MKPLSYLKHALKLVFGYTYYIISGSTSKLELSEAEEIIQRRSGGCLFVKVDLAGAARENAVIGAWVEIENQKRKATIMQIKRINSIWTKYKCAVS
jgi:hypothetical protein